MHIRSITLRRAQDTSDYLTNVDYTKPLVAKVHIVGVQSENMLTLSEEASLRLMHVIKDELAASAKRVAEAMIPEIFEGTLLEAPKPYSHLLDSSNLDDEIPF